MRESGLLFTEYIYKNIYTDSKFLNGTVYNVTKAFLDKCGYCGSFYSSKNPEKNLLNCFKYL